MGTLDKKNILFQRDDKNELLPEEVEVIVDEKDESQLEFKGQKVFMTPMTRGEIRAMFKRFEGKSPEADEDADGKLIFKHIKKPEFTEEDIPFIKGPAASVLVNTILYYSGIDTGKGSRKKAIQAAEDDFAKN